MNRKRLYNGRVRDMRFAVTFKLKDGRSKTKFFHTAANAVRAVRGWAAKGGKIYSMSPAVSALKYSNRKFLRGGTIPSWL